MWPNNPLKAIAKTLCSCSRFQRDENWKWHCEAHRWEKCFQISPTIVWLSTEPANSSDLFQIREFLHPHRPLCFCNCSSLQFGQIADSRRRNLLCQLRRHSCPHIQIEYKLREDARREFSLTSLGEHFVVFQCNFSSQSLVDTTTFRFFCWADQLYHKYQCYENILGGSIAAGGFAARAKSSTPL